MIDIYANIDVYTVPFEFALDDSDNADQRTFKVGTVAGKAAYNRSLVFEVVNKSGVGLQSIHQDMQL